MKWSQFLSPALESKPEKMDGLQVPVKLLEEKKEESREEKKEEPREEGKEEPSEEKKEEPREEKKEEKKEEPKEEAPVHEKEENEKAGKAVEKKEMTLEETIKEIIENGQDNNDIKEKEIVKLLNEKEGHKRPEDFRKIIQAIGDTIKLSSPEKTLFFSTCLERAIIFQRVEDFKKAFSNGSQTNEQEKIENLRSLLDFFGKDKCCINANSEEIMVIIEDLKERIKNSSLLLNNPELLIESETLLLYLAILGCIPIEDIKKIVQILNAHTEKMTDQALLTNSAKVFAFASKIGKIPNEQISKIEYIFSILRLRRHIQKAEEDKENTSQKIMEGLLEGIKVEDYQQKYQTILELLLIDLKEKEAEIVTKESAAILKALIRGKEESRYKEILAKYAGKITNYQEFNEAIKAGLECAIFEDIIFDLRSLKQMHSSGESALSNCVGKEIGRMIYKEAVMEEGYPEKIRRNLATDRKKSNRENK